MASNLNEYYSSQGQTLPSVQARASVYESMGLGSAQEYKGGADQNTRLLQALAAGAKPAVAPAPAGIPTPVPTAVPQAQPTGIPTPSQPSTPQSAKDLVAMGYSGYAGWGDKEAIGDFQATKGQGKGGPSAVGMSAAQPTLNLPQLYEGLYQSAGIKDKEAELSAKEQQLALVKSKINDNPFLSEGTRVGRVAKLDQLYQDQTAGIRKDIETKKADIEMQLNLRTKQFDIDSQVAQQAQKQFNNLLEMGALDNASGADIANITRSTGMSSALINSAIEARKKKNTQTSIQQFDDGLNQGFMVVSIDDNGNIVNTQKQVTGQSKGTGGGGGTVGEREQNRMTQILVQDLQNGLTLADAIALYKDDLSLSDITQIYNQYSIYGPAQESGEKIRSLYEPPKQTGSSSSKVSKPSFESNYSKDLNFTDQ